MSKRFLAAGLALIMLVMIGCAKGKTTETGDTTVDPSIPVEGGTLNLSMFSAPKGVFSPVLYVDTYDANVINLVFNGLLRTNENLEWACDLCQSFDVSADNRTVTFKLRTDVKWHDGKPFTAKDVAFTFQAMIHPDYAGVRTGDYAALIGVEAMLDQRDELFTQVGERNLTDAEAATAKLATWQTWLDGDGKKAITVIDDHTISFSTEEPYAPFLQNLAFAIKPSHVFEGTEIAKLEEHAAIRKPIGTGPYKFVEYRTDQFVRLERYEGFHFGKPRIPTIIYKIVNQEVAVGQLSAGELDFIQILPADVELVKDNSNITIEQRADFGYQYMGINFDHPFLKDKTVRQAMAYAINRKAMVDQLLLGYGTVMNSHMPPALWAYDASKLNAYEHNRQKASELLAQAGWIVKDSAGYLVKDGKVLEFTLKYPSGNAVREASAPLIQANLKDVGIKVNLEMAEFSTLADAVFDHRNMDAWLMGWALSIDPDPGPIFLPNNKWGRVTGWTNARNEELIRLGTRVLQISDRKPLYVEWASILNDELPYVFLYSQNVVDAIRTDRISGLRPDARGTLWNIWELWIPAAKQ